MFAVSVKFPPPTKDDRPMLKIKRGTIVTNGLAAIQAITDPQWSLLSGSP